MTATAETTEATNAWVNSDEASAEDYAPWHELLSREQNIRGLQRITVEVFAGRSGHKELSELRITANDKGGEVGPGVVPELKAETIAREAYNLCAKDHKRTARNFYRMRLWTKPKRNAPETPGEYVTIKFGSDGSDYYEGNDGNLSPALMRELVGALKDSRRFIIDLIDGQVRMSQASTGTSLLGLQAVEHAAELRLKLADDQAKIVRAPTAADVTARWAAVAARLEKPAQTIANALSPLLAKWAYNMASEMPGPNGSGQPPNGHGSNGHDAHADAKARVHASQQRAQAFFAELTTDQKDKLRDALGQNKFRDIVEVIHGDTLQWAEESPHLSATLRPHLAALMAILTPPQLQQLMEVAN